MAHLDLFFQVDVSMPGSHTKTCMEYDGRWYWICVKKCLALADVEIMSSATEQVGEGLKGWW